jgi:hypothetical protein
MAHKIVHGRNVYNLLGDSNGRDRLGRRIALILGHVEEQHVTRRVATHVGSAISPQFILIISGAVGFYLCIDTHLDAEIDHIEQSAVAFLLVFAADLGLKATATPQRLLP